MNRREYELKQANCDRWIARIGSSIIFAALVGVYAVLTDLTGWLDPVLFPGWGMILPEMVQSSKELFKGLFFSLRYA